MFTKTDYLDLFRGVKDLLDNNDASAYSYIEEKHPKLAGRMRALMERLMAQDPPFMKKVFEGWFKLTLGNPLLWRQVSQERMTEEQRTMFREFEHAQVDLMAETWAPKDRLRHWVEQERVLGLPVSVIRRQLDRAWRRRP